MRGSASVLVVVAALALAGCATTNAPPEAPPEPSTIAEAPGFTMADFCDGVSRVASAVWNEDVGFLQHGVRAEDWAARIASAASQADTLVAATPKGDMHSAAERLRAAVAAAVAPPMGRTPDSYDRVGEIFRQINQGVGGCIANGTEAPLMAEFGG